MRYLIIALSIACLDSEKEETEEGENVNPRLASMTASINTFISNNNGDEVDCTKEFSNDSDAIDIDCEICDVYGFVVYEGYSGDCIDDDGTDFSEQPIKNLGYGLNLETSQLYFLEGTAWSPAYTYDCETTDNQGNSAYCDAYIVENHPDYYGTIIYLWW
jgi:hypothetical protein